jgi:hypothetical protein
MSENPFFIGYSDRSRVVCKFVAVAAWLILDGVCFHARLSAEGLLTPGKLGDLTEFRRQEIKTAELVLLYSNSRCDSNVTFADVEVQLNDFYDRIASEPDVDRVADLLSRLLENIAGRSSELSLPELRIVQKGDQVRNIVDVESEPRGDFGFARGVSSVFRNSANTLTLDAGETSDRRYTIFDIRPVLESPESWEIIDPINESGQTLLQMALSPKPKNSVVYNSLVDTKSGNILRLWVDGVFYRIRSAFEQFDSVSLPRCGIDLYFKNGVLARYFAFALVDASINEVVGEDALITKANKGVRVVDVRNPQKVVRIYSDKDESDPVELADSFLAQSVPSRPENGWSSSFYTVAACGILVLLLVLALKRSRVSKH